MNNLDKYTLVEIVTAQSILMEFLHADPEKWFAGLTAADVLKEINAAFEVKLAAEFEEKAER